MGMNVNAHIQRAKQYKIFFFIILGIRHRRGMIRCAMQILSIDPRFILPFPTSVGRLSPDFCRPFADICNQPGPLRGFEKKNIQPGQHEHFAFNLTRRDLSHWDVGKQAWGFQTGTYPIYVGKSVLDIQLTGKLQFS